MSKIFETTQYDKFDFVPQNRSVRNLTKIRNSMRKYGFIVGFPICVVQQEAGGKFLILDGQHRFEAAKSLKLPVRYVIHNGEAFNIAEVNNTQNKWTPLDYLNSHINAGHAEYSKLKGFMDTYHVPLSIAIGLLRGSCAGGNAPGTAEFKSGAFQCTDESHAHRVMGLITRVSDVVKFSRNTKFVEAVSRCVLVKEFDHARFVHAVHAYSFKLKLQPNVDFYLQMIDDIYNWHAKKPIPLRFMAEQAVKARTRALVTPGKSRAAQREEANATA